MTKKIKYDIIGHISYPWCEEIMNCLFYKVDATTYVIKRNGVTISAGRSNKSIVDFIVENGPYTVEEIKTTRWHGRRYLCGCPINALRDPNRGEPTTAYILIKATSLTDLVKNSEIIYEYIKGETGIDGGRDIFTMLEECK